MTSTTYLVSRATHTLSDDVPRPQFRLRGNSFGFWVERRRSALVVDRVMSVYDRFDTYWTGSLEEATRRFLRIPGVA